MLGRPTIEMRGPGLPCLYAIATFPLTPTDNYQPFDCWGAFAHLQSVQRLTRETQITSPFSNQPTLAKSITSFLIPTPKTLQRSLSSPDHPLSGLGGE